TGPTSLYEDNQACIRISENPCDGERVKHIDAKYHLVRQNVMNKIVKLHYCSTENMVADAFTKALAGPKIKKFNAFMMGADKPPHANGKDIEDAGKPKLK
ncbi:MAG: Ty1/Copia family ribonuclease HI, partial [Flavobacteriales bacterium]